MHATVSPHDASLKRAQCLGGVSKRGAGRLIVSLRSTEVACIDLTGIVGTTRNIGCLLAHAAWRIFGRPYLLFAFLGAATGYAESYPSKPIRWIVPFPISGGADVIARLVGQRLSESWGQQVVIDNRTGATGLIGTVLAAKAAPDGYTILMGNTATHGINPSLFKKLPYDPIRDFAPITLVATPPEVLLVHPSLAANSVGDLIALAKASAGMMSFGSAGKGSAPHLAGERLKLMAKINIIHVPYKGSSPALIDLMGGHISMYFSNVVSAMPLLKSGKLKGLAVTSAQRTAALPDLPTMSESGLSGYEESNWYVVLAPARTPRTIVDVLNKKIVEALMSKQIKDNLAKDGAAVIGSTPEECGIFIKSEIAKYAAIVKAAQIVPD